MDKDNLLVARSLYQCSEQTREFLSSLVKNTKIRFFITFYITMILLLLQIHKLMIFGMKNISKFKSVKALKNICAEYRSFYQIPIRAELLNVLHKNNFRKIVQGDNYA